MINSNLLLSQMKLKGMTIRDLAAVQGWSMTTAYRKVNGKTACTAPEIQVVVDRLELTLETAETIFFASHLS